MSDTKSRLRDALDTMFETAEDNRHRTLEVTAQNLAHAAEVEGKTGSVSIDAARQVLHDVARGRDAVDGDTARFALPR